MKQYCARLALLLGSMLMTLAGNLLALASAIAGSDRAFRVAVSNDQTLNAALDGSEDETIIAAFVQLDSSEIAGHEPSLVFVNERNQQVELRHHIPTQQA